MGLLAQHGQEHRKEHGLAHGQGDALQRGTPFPGTFLGVIDQQKESSDEFCGRSVTKNIKKKGGVVFCSN